MTALRVYAAAAVVVVTLSAMYLPELWYRRRTLCLVVLMFVAAYLASLQFGSLVAG